MLLLHWFMTKIHTLFGEYMLVKTDALCAYFPHTEFIEKTLLFTREPVKIREVK